MRPTTDDTRSRVKPGGDPVQACAKHLSSAIFRSGGPEELHEDFASGRTGKLGNIYILWFGRTRGFFQKTPKKIRGVIACTLKKPEPEDGGDRVQAQRGTRERGQKSSEWHTFQRRRRSSSAANCGNF